MSKGYDWINSFPKGVGHTTAACGKGDGKHVVIVPTLRQAQQVYKEHGVHAHSLTVPQDFLGRTHPFVFDVEAVKTIVNYYEHKLRLVKDAVHELGRNADSATRRLLNALDS